MTAGTYRIRPMTAADIPALVEIASTLFHAPHWPASAYLAALNPAASPRRIALVAEHTPSPTLVGFLVAGLVPPDAELETIAVTKDHQKRGLARQLLHTLAAQLASTGVTDLHLEVRASNRPALSLYRRAGFVQTGLRSRYYSDPVEDAVLLRQTLTQTFP
jgi:[ribosomal protein S18]-alanine N-acetyltransferase